MRMTSDFNKEGTRLLFSSRPRDWLRFSSFPFLGDSSSWGQLPPRLKLGHFGRVQRSASFSLELCFWDLGRNVIKSVDWNVILFSRAMPALPEPLTESGKDPQFGTVTQAKHRVHLTECLVPFSTWSNSNWPLKPTFKKASLTSPHP